MRWAVGELLNYNIYYKKKIFAQNTRANIFFMYYDKSYRFRTKGSMLFFNKEIYSNKNKVSEIFSGLS